MRARLVWFLAAFALVSAAIVSAAAATGTSTTLWSAKGFGLVSSEDGSGLVAFDVDAKETGWDVPVDGWFTFAGKIRYNGSPATVVVRMEQIGYGYSGCAGPAGDPYVVFSSVNPDGGRLVIRSLSGRVLVNERVYVKASVQEVSGGKALISMYPGLDLNGAPLHGWADITGVGCKSPRSPPA